MRKLDRSLHQVHSKRLHNDTHVPCSLQSPHSKGIGMITSIWNCPWTVRYTIRVSLHPYHLVMSMTESCRWVMQCRLRARRPRASNKGLRPFPLRTEISPVSLNLLLMLCTRSVVLKPVLGTPSHSIFCMSPSFNTPDSTHQLISRVCKTWNGCGLWERLTKCVVAGGPQDRFENHCTRWWDLQSLCNLTLRNVVFKVFHHLFTHSFTDWRASAHLYFWETLPL